MPPVTDNPRFAQVQRQFTQHIRDPERHPPPPDVEDRRMGIYRQLFYNNVESFMSSNFPVLRTIIADEPWHAMVRHYFATHEAHTPLFPKMPMEFLHYLEHERKGSADHLDDPPFMLELAHYEWVESALRTDSREICLDGIDPEGDLLAGIPVLSPLALPLAYQFPVHRISVDYQPQQAGDSPTYLVVYRNRQDTIEFMGVNLVTARLLEKLLKARDNTGQALLEEIAMELGHPNPQVVMGGGHDIMRQLLAKDILLGVKTHRLK